MPAFNYRGRDNKGALVVGQMDAPDDGAVLEYLASKSIVPVEIAIDRGGAALAVKTSLFSKSKKLKLEDLIFFSRQMHTLLRAGVPILEALQSLGRSSHAAVLSEVITGIIVSLNTGTGLSGAMRQRKDIFPNLYISLIELGEASGNLPEVFAQLAIYLEQDQATKKQIKSAVRYPMFVVIAISIAVIIVNVFVIPTFAGIFSKFNAELPLPTRILIASSNFTINYWYILVMAGGAIFWQVRRYINTVNGRIVWDRRKLKLPLLGKILYGATLARFCRALAMNLRAGVPWNVAMNMLSETVDNAFVAGHVLRMRDGVEQGQSITRTATETGMFPPLVLQMMDVGEQSGSIDKLMLEVAQFYESEVDYGLKRLGGSIEPILTIAMAILVLIIALGVFLPMWGLADAAMPKS